MLHGRKGFDRVVYAFKNVLTASVTWLFCNLAAAGMQLLFICFWYILTRQEAPSPDPLEQHFPIPMTVVPEEVSGIKVTIPPLQPPVDVGSEYDEDFEDFAFETQEWLSLVSLNSPRIKADDQIDSFLSRYVSPGESKTPANIVKITWRGFFSPEWAHKMLVQAFVALPKSAWFVFSVAGFEDSWSEGSKGCTVLRVPDTQKEYVVWEIAQ